MISICLWHNVDIAVPQKLLSELRRLYEIQRYSYSCARKYSNSGRRCSVDDQHLFRRSHVRISEHPACASFELMCIWDVPDQNQQTFPRCPVRNTS
jgi:hypothetical protein